MRIYSLAVVFSFFTSFALTEAAAQQVTGYVFGVDSGGRTDLEGATVIWAGTTEGVVTDADGFFSIPVSRTGTTLLQASYLGYGTQTIDIAGRDGDIIFELTLNELDEIVVSQRRSGTTFSRLATQKVETITGAGLLKMACCNLSESFENSATVTVGFTDAISGARQVQLLGLSGIYTQMMDENVPTMRTLASTYGWSYTPGPWLESI